MNSKKESICYFLDNFEGPIDCLLHLVQKHELDLTAISLKAIVDQFSRYLIQSEDETIDEGAEFIGHAATLLCLKSKSLLPQHDAVETEEEQDLNPKFEMIQQLIEYCRFRDAGKALTALESDQKSFYMRGQDPSLPIPKPLGIEHLTVNDLAGLFKEALKKASVDKGQIHEETWKVSDKIRLIRQTLASDDFLPLSDLFRVGMGRIELIVTFLAILELMKMGKAKVVQSKESGEVMVVKGDENHG